ncbi:MAG: haloacid dehalogenase-like hydrolase, partial [Candidatus Diapherotrites archaeon]|nr:haloacid dehalogenase-like hydrolase [Candidatus Diapherotrites archaeon]
MAREPCSKVAVLDFDDTLLKGSFVTRIVKRLVNPRRSKNILPRRYYLKALRYSHLPVLSKLKRFYRVYRYLLRSGYRFYLDILGDPKVDREGLFRVIRETVQEAELPPESRAFLEALRKKGYKLILVTAIPQEIAELLGDRFGFDEVYGSKPGLLLDREGKERIIKELKKRYCVDIIVGNPG